MTPTEQLREEHQGITLMLKILEKVCTKMEAQEKVNPEHLESIVDFFRVFADKCHHGKESHFGKAAALPGHRKKQRAKTCARAGSGKKMRLMLLAIGFWPLALSL